jgi:glycosyltransferase involved in cell wall biosynthesis
MSGSMTSASTQGMPAKEVPFLSVVISFYNEEGVIAELLRRLRAVMTEQKSEGKIKGYELVFVNDRSRDASEMLLRREIELNGDIVLVNMSRNFGNAECIFAGIRHASGDVVVYMDADLQDPPELIPKLVAAWQEDPEVEVVYTTRLSRAGEHPLKLLYTRWGYRLINAISDVNLPVDSGDFRLLSRRAKDHLLQIEEAKPYLRGLVSWIGFKQVPIFYHREPRLDGRSATKFPVLSRRVLSYHLDRALISFSDVPLKFCLLLGFGMSFLSGLYLCVVLFQKYMGWYEPGWPALMATILLTGGFQFIVLGVFGLYLNIIFLEVKRRPNYIVESVIRRTDAGVTSDQPSEASRSARY